MSEWSEYNYDPGLGSSNQNQSQYGGFYDGSAANYDTSAPTFMTPAPLDQSQNNGAQFGAQGGEDFSDEPPLLEELGINVDHIVQKTLAVLNPFRATAEDVAGDADLAGPLVFCLAFGSLLLLVGKVHFNYIYGFGVLGCLGIYALLSLMSSDPVHLGVVVSVLGYCILPIVLLSALSVVASLQGILGNLLACAAVVWCALSASKLFVTAFKMKHQQLLVAYPCSLLYAIFALITMF